MNHSLELKIPKTLNNIRLHQWVKFLDIYEKNKDSESEEFLNKKVLEIFCGVSLKEIYKIPISSFDAVLSHIYNLLNSNTPLIRTFKLKGVDDVEVEFGFIPNLDKMSYGEWEDLENYIQEPKNLHKAMAVLYRPIAFKKKDRYLIHEYKGSEEYSEVMKDIPIDVALGAKVFFYRLARKLGDYTMAYTLKELQEREENHSNEDLEKNGEVIKQYLNSLEEMSEKLTRLQKFQYTNV